MYNNTYIIKNIDTIIEELINRNLITMNTIIDITDLIKDESNISSDFHIAKLGISERLTKILTQQKLDLKNSKIINYK